MILEFHGDMMDTKIGTLIDTKMVSEEYTAGFQMLLHMRDSPATRRAYLLGRVLGRLGVLAVWRRTPSAIEWLAKSPAFQEQTTFFPFSSSHKYAVHTMVLERREIPNLNDVDRLATMHFRGNVSSVVLFHPQHRIVAAWERDEGDNPTIVALNPLLYNCQL